MSELSAKTLVEPLQLQFSDNSVLPLLFGEHDRHLARIEQLLGVSIVSRGNCLAIIGPSAQAEVARLALQMLYKRARRGVLLDMGEVDAAVRMADPALRSQAEGETLAIRTKRRLVEARSCAQRAYIEALRERELVFAIGPAGTGKTYIAVAQAVAMLIGGQITRLILSRPAVEAGERLGFLPGDMREKIDPYLRPLYDALYDMLSADEVLRRLSNGEIEVAPLAFMRGRTLANSYIILDEAQNTTPTQMKMFLTRMGENSRMVVTGDLSQVDLPLGAKSGLRDALDILEPVAEIAIVRFTEADVVRHPLVTRIVKAYARHDALLSRPGA